MHSEWGTISAETADALNAARASGGRIVAVGTTSLRLLESAAGEDGTIAPFTGETAIFITPGYRFRAVDILMTNFHLPRSTLFMLVAAFSGLETMKQAYAHAIAGGYRFYSYGDACLLFPDRVRRMSASPTISSFSAAMASARTGVLTTPHGAVRTPAFMPVGTQGAMKGLHWREMRDAGADIVLGNTYHLMLRPGAERIAELGGLQKFTTWDGPMLTDSGGFQVMSLAQLRKVEEQGVTFRSHIDGAAIELTPERAIEVQRLLGSDIAMQLDECVRLPAERGDIERAMQLSLRWAERSKRAFEGAPAGHMLFGIVQGGDSPELRRASARGLTEIGFHGYAIGGLAVGEPQAVMLAMIEETVAVAAAGPAAVSDGCRHAGRFAGSGGARHRHVRLRHADAERAPRHGLYPFRPDQSSQRAPRRRPAST